ncbi:MAG: ABC transporter ATP-binding protein [Oscillospiraceae bacterium]|jgi:peptide/nickel transport system ATP-binding protein|nr:ABC transporter ATP-binding protein [Oscillospiraceae bacterium]
MSLLQINDLTIHYVTRGGTVKAVNGIDLSIEAGRTLGLVGETGAGKTTSALGILGLIPKPPGKIISGQILFEGADLLKASQGKMRMIRGNDISMIYQDPMTALNPILRVGDQISEVIIQHSGCSKAEAREKSEGMLETVGIRAERAADYPHQFSGGMKQRAVIAMALACNPKLLIADEPTTALDVTIQAQVLEMMRELKDELGSSMLLITHDLGIVAETCDDVAIMYAGEIVEIGALERIFHNPRHPYTLGLFGSIPSLDKDVRRLNPIPGLMPDPADLPSGCKFHARCAHACDDCGSGSTELCETERGHFVRCRRVAGGEI